MSRIVKYIDSQDGAAPVAGRPNDERGMRSIPDMRRERSTNRPAAGSANASLPSLPRRGLLSVGALLAAWLAWPGGAAAGEALEALEAPLAPQAYAPLSAEFRSAVTRLAILPHDAATAEAISGTYRETQPGLVGGVEAGRHRTGIPVGVGPARFRINVPYLQISSAVFGGLRGAAKKKIQAFRDALTKDLVNADRQPLKNSSLALDVHRHISSLSAVEAQLLSSTAGIPDTTGAALFVGFDDFKMDIDGKRAILILTASAALRRRSDNKLLYSRTMTYQDTDTLENWTKDELALWRDYTNFAAHYLARELAGETFFRQLMPLTLTPRATASARRQLEGRFVSDSPAPELAWDAALRETEGEAGNGEALPEPIAISELAWDIEIYDAHRIVYRGRASAPSHVLSDALTPCRTYRWSVRPSYGRGKDTGYGDWMRLVSAEGAESSAAFKGRNGLIGREASAAPAYTQDFPELEISCSGGSRRSAPRP